MQSTRGSTRLVLVGVLSAAAVLLVASLAVLLGGDGGPPVDDAGDTRRFVPDGASRTARARVDVDDDEEDDEEDIYDWSDGGRVEGGREPWGDVFAVTPDSLRRVLADRHWEEIRRQIDVLQRNGGQVPTDVVEALLQLLTGEDTRIDAVLALGGVKSDEAGEMLAARASDSSWPLEVRAAALDAIAVNGSPAALGLVQALLVQPDLDPKLLRHAYPALGGIGGPEAARTLVAALQAHADDDLTGSLVSALGKARGAGVALAQTLRRARDGGDAGLAALLLQVGHLHGAAADDALRTEIRVLIEDSAALEAIAKPERRLALRVSALSAAAAMGGELLAPVVRMALLAEMSTRRREVSVKV